MEYTSTSSIDRRIGALAAQGSVSTEDTLYEMPGTGKEGESSDETTLPSGGKDGEMSKLEQKRLKNRLKQRSLRPQYCDFLLNSFQLNPSVRRAKHVQTLESTVTDLQSKVRKLQTTITQIQTRKAALQSWVRDLELSLFQHRLNEELEGLRVRWAIAAGVNYCVTPKEEVCIRSDQGVVLAWRDSTTVGEGGQVVAEFQLQERSRWEEGRVPKSGSRWAPTYPCSGVEALQSENRRKRKTSHHNSFQNTTEWVSESNPAGPSRCRTGTAPHQIESSPVYIESTPSTTGHGLSATSNSSISN